MNVTEINIIPIKQNKGLVALASCVLDNNLYIGSIGIYTKLEGGYRLTYPTKKTNENSIRLFHPINKEFGDLIEDAIINEYKKLIETSHEDLHIEHNEE